MEHRESISISLGTMMRAVLVLLFYFVLFLLKDLVLVLLMSIVFASAIEPATRWLVEHKIPRIFAVISIYICIALCLFGAVFFLILPLLSESSDFLRNFPAYFNPGVLSSTLSNSSFFSSQPFVATLTSSLNLEEVISGINTVIGNIYSNAFGTITTIFGGILSFFLMVILSFYLAVEENGVGKFLKAISPIRSERYIISLWERSQKKIGLWMQGQLVLAIVIGMLVYLGLLIVQLPNPLLLATLAALLEIIPLFGPILAGVPAVMIAFATGGLPLAGIVVGLYIIIHQFENQLIYPLVVKKVVGVSPIVSILALAIGWKLAGFIGVVLSVPMAAVFIELFNDFEKDKLERLGRMNEGN